MQKYTSANTSINSTKAPAIYSMGKAISIISGKKVIDIGGGKYDTGVKKAAEYGATVSIYDPYNRDIAHNKSVLSSAYDVAIISNVLNVIDTAEDRASVLMLAAEKADIILITFYEGDKSGVGHQSGTDSWQENRKTSDYIPEISGTLKTWNVSRHGKLIICEK